MKCQYCDSVINPVPENGVCPNCGYSLKMERLKLPFSLIKAQGGFVELNKQGIRLCVKHPRKPRKDITIPYKEIYDVSYVPANWWHNGFLCVREKKKQHIPLPRKFGQHWLGDTIAFFDEKKNDVFYQVYVFLRTCIDADKA